MKRFVWLLMGVGLVSACKSESADPPPEPSPAAAAAAAEPAKPAQSAGAQADSKQEEPGGSNGDMAASAIGKPLDDLTDDDITAALKKGGWSTNGSSVSRSPEGKAKKWVSIRIDAEKGKATAEVLWFQGKDSWKREDIEKKGGAYHQVKDDVFLGVTIRGDKTASKTLLDSLVGSG